jgi:hypothetical protein
VAEVDRGRASELANEKLGRSSPVTALVELRLARGELRKRELVSAAARIDVALDIIQTQLGPSHPQVAAGLLLRSQANGARGRLPQAAADRERAAAIGRAIAPRSSVCREPVV